MMKNRKLTSVSEVSAVKSGASPRQVDAGERERMVAEAAYYLAQQRGFQGGTPEQDWYAAEAQINEQFKRSRSN